MAFFEILPLSRNKIYLNGSLVEKDIYLNSESKIWFKNYNNPPALFSDILYDESGYVVVDDKLYVIGARKSNSHYGHQFTSGGMPVWIYSNDEWNFIELGGASDYLFNDGVAILYNNKIHIFGGWNGTTTGGLIKHVSWDMESRQLVSEVDLPSEGACHAGAVVLSNGIHRIGGYGSTAHQLYNGSTWSTVGVVPGEYNYGNALISAVNNKIFLFGLGRVNNSDETYYTYDQTNGWQEIDDLPWSGHSGSARYWVKYVFLYKGKIHILVDCVYDYSGLKRTRFYSYNGSSWDLENFGDTDVIQSTCIANGVYPIALMPYKSEIMLFSRYMDTWSSATNEGMFKSYSTYSISNKEV